MIRNSKKIIFSLFLSSFFIISLLPQNFLDISSANVNDTLEDDFVINPIVKTNPKFDVNKNKIQDKLEKSLVANPEEEITVIVTFNTPLNSDLRKKIELLGGEIQSEWSIFYGAPIKIRSKDVFFLSSIANIEFIRENTLCYPFLSTTTQQVNVRPYVWETLGLEGNSEHAIAILDSGIDDSHPDLAGKIIHWEDFIGKDWYTEDDEYTEPIDLLGHGSHCASIACGSGEAGGTKKYITESYNFAFPANVPEDYGLPYYIQNEDYGNISMYITWDDISGNAPSDTLFVTLDINGDDAANMTEDLHVFGDYQDGALKLTSNILPPGKHRFLIGQKEDSEIGPSIIQVNITRAAANLNDGYNNYRGIAPNCNIVGIKVIDDSGVGDIQTIIDGIDWVAEFGKDLGVVVCSLSLGFLEEISEIDSAINNLVGKGIICTVAAGNSFLDDTLIGSPGTALRAISVGAINDVDQIAYYSSNGFNFGPHTKPDVVAPGGSILRESNSYLVIGVDSNNGDYVDAEEIETLYGVSRYHNNEQNFNDYSASQGTSMSCPHVAGIVALIIEAMGEEWTYSYTNAKKIKNLICGTATEVLKGESVVDYSNIPVENRGEKDEIEGWGKIHANAAIEALITEITLGANTSAGLTKEPLGTQCWARKLTIPKKTALQFSLEVPATADFDLYLYDLDENFEETDEGYLIKSIDTRYGEDESFIFSTSREKTAYIAVKCVEGYGTFNLSIISTTYTGEITMLFFLLFGVLGLTSLNFLRKRLK